jgi:hypothetical protein
MRRGREAGKGGGCMTSRVRRAGPQVDYGEAMELSTPLGIALVVVGLIVAVKAAKTMIKVLMLVVILGGLYLWFGQGQDLSSLNPF